MAVFHMSATLRVIGCRLYSCQFCWLYACFVKLSGEQTWLGSLFLLDFNKFINRGLCKVPQCSMNVGRGCRGWGRRPALTSAWPALPGLTRTLTSYIWILYETNILNKIRIEAKKFHCKLFMQMETKRAPYNYDKFLVLVLQVFRNMI